MRFTQRGDTIVEVLMCLAILGLVLAGAFSIANQSLLIARRAQERSEALKYTEGQIEKLRTVASRKTPPTFAELSQSNLYCLNDSLLHQDLGMSSLPALSSYDPTPYQANCQANSLYSYSIQYQQSGTPPTIDHIFTVTTRWERAGGGGNEELTLIYKVHP